MKCLFQSVSKKAGAYAVFVLLAPKDTFFGGGLIKKIKIYFLFKYEMFFF